MRLTGSAIGLLVEEATTGGSMQVTIVFDVKERVQAASVEEIRDTILKRQAHCGLLFYSGGAPDGLEDDIIRAESRIGKEGIIKSIPMTRRDMDLLVVVNKVKDYLLQRDRDQLDLERLDSECRRLWRKVEHEVELLISQLYARGYILSRYTLEENTTAVLLSLYMAYKDGGSRNLLTRAYNEYLKPIFGVSLSIYARDIERIEGKASKLDLFNTESKLFLAPPFLINLCESLRGPLRVLEQVRANFLLADSSHLERWLNYLLALKIISKVNDQWKLITDLEEITQRIEVVEVTDPDDIDNEDEFGGKLRNFANHLGYRDLVEMIVVLRNRCMDQIADFSPSDLSHEDFTNNLGAPIAVLENAFSKVIYMIEEARRRMERSKINIEEGREACQSAVQELGRINAKIDRI